MNEYIVQIISANRLWLISQYSHHTLKKHQKMTAKNGHPCTEWFSSLCLQTNRKHMEKQSLICMRKTSFYMHNINTHDSCIFDQLIVNVCPVCTSDVLQTRTENFEPSKKMTASLQNHQKRRMCSDPCICTTQRYLGFFSEVLHKIWRIFPRSFDTVVISDVPTSNILYKTNEKAVYFLSTTSGTSRDLSWVPSFSRPHGVSLFGNT